MSSEKEITSTVRKNQGKIFGFIRNRVSNREDAEDILQEVWFQLSRIMNLDDIENVSAWLYKVARNKITDWYKKSKPLPADNDLFDEQEGVMIKNLLFNHSETPEDKMFKDLIWQELMKGLDELPSNQREVFIQNELEGLKLREIAENTNEKLKTIISRKQYAVKHLRGKLRNLYDDILN